MSTIIDDLEMNRRREVRRESRRPKFAAGSAVIGLLAIALLYMLAVFTHWSL